MLVLTRKKGEGIVIGKDITITLLEVKGEGVKIGIDAPKSVNICRQEIFLDIESTNKTSVVPKGDIKRLANFLKLNNSKGEEE